MSYCRWTTDDSQSDVYVHKDIQGGWTTNVARRRYRFAEPLPPPPDLDPSFTADQSNAWHDRNQAVYKMVTQAELVDIGLPHDGATFNDDTPGECADRLAALRELGYHVPDGVIETLREEQRR